MGLIFTFGIVWSLLALAASRAALWAWVRLRSHCFFVPRWPCLWAAAFYGTIRFSRYAWLIPLRDLIAAGVWVVSLGGHTVTWRGERFRLKAGKLTRIVP